MEGTPYILFGMLFFCLIGFSLLSVFSPKSPKFMLMRSILLWVSIGISLGGASITAIVDRHATAPIWGTHDIILQQEAAIRYLTQKKNPYKETYFGTPVEMFRYEEIGNPKATNPALYHFVMPPGYLLLPLPFYWLANRLFGYFDGRMVLVMLMIGSLVVLSRWFKKKDIGEVAMILTALSPAAVDYFIEGRSDLFALAFLIGALYFFKKPTVYVATLFFSLAMLSKQTMWFAMPLYLAQLYTFYRKDWKQIMLHVLFMAIIGSIFVGPFLVWNAQAFLDSVIFYLSSGGATGYPVSGYGLSMILYSLKVIKGLHDYYPFLLWQGVFGLPTIVVSIWFFLKKPSHSRFLLGFALTLFSIWYTSRYFNNSHVAVVAGLFTLGILKHYDEYA